MASSSTKIKMEKTDATIILTNDGYDILGAILRHKDALLMILDMWWRRFEGTEWSILHQ